MRLKLVFLFLLTVLIPTILLAYFSFFAIRNEASLVESHLRQRYQAMADIVLHNITTELKNMPEKLRSDPNAMRSFLYKHTQLFDGEVMIFDRTGAAVDGARDRTHFPSPVYVANLTGFPYEIAVYERYQLLSNQFESVRKRLSGYVIMVSLCTVALLLGGFFMLGQLFFSWKKIETKEEFMMHLVHDLRKPLTSIRMFSEMLENDRVQSEQKRKEYYRIISVESGKLIGFVNNLIDFSRMENRKEPYVLQDEDLIAVVTETVARFRSYFVNETHKISLELPKSLPKVHINGDLISQALINLLSNAVKYSPVGSEIKVSLTRQGKLVVLSVLDSGLGISKQNQKRIFQKYYRAKETEVRNREGSGLGLAQVKQAVLANRGKISVKSEEGKGSEFRIQLSL